MSSLAVHQFLPTFGHRDAIANITHETRRALRQAGIAGGIWAEGIHPANMRHASFYPAYAKRRRRPRRARDVIFYQASTGSRGLVDFLLERPEPKTLCYHNITPAEFFEPYDPGDALLLARGREELKLLAAQVPVALADSEYNARELRAAGVADVRVVPPYLPPKLDTPADRSVASRLRETKKGIDVLFVGRVVPNKGHLHLLRAFAALRAAVDPGARLFIVGSWGPDAYIHELFRLRERLGLEGVTFTGSVSEATLSAYYEDADVYLSMSQHEGYGLPLIEAMRTGVPVVAYDAGAVSETLGGSGVLVRTLDPPLVAELVGRLARDGDLRARVVEGQLERVREVERAPRDEPIVEAVRMAAG